MRKIDDNILLEMLKTGKTQKEIAEHFGVSPVAVCKRLKRLLPPPDLNKYGLTEKQKGFVIEKAKGKTNTQAAMTSYDVNSLESAKTIGKNLMDKPEVKDAITELMNFHGMTRSYRIGKLKNHVDHIDPIVSLKALDMTFKLDGSYGDQNQGIHLNSLSLIIHQAHEKPQTVIDGETEDGQPAQDEPN
jgi:DNA-binding Lrp family transcriptional regulator